MEKFIEDSPYSKQYHLVNEFLNSLTHGLTAILALVGLYFLLVKATTLGNQTEFMAYLIYGASMFILFASSAIYHTFKYTKANAVLRRLDHCSIFLLIAGTYTPFTLVSIGGGLGMGLTIFIWLIAFLGILYKTIWFKHLQGLSVYFYIGMGWVGIPFFHILYQEIGIQGLLWLFVGGLTYSFGTIFYRMKHTRFMHVVWHLFVIGGAFCMYVSVLFYV